MPSYEKLTGKILSDLELARTIRNFAITSGLFTDAGNINGEKEFSLRHKDGVYFNLKFNNSDMYGCMTKSLPTGSFSSLLPSKDSAAYVNNEYNLTRTSGLIFPLINCFLINTGNFIAIVVEIKNGVYRHFVLGKYQTYGNIDGGEIFAGTATGVGSGINQTSRYLWGAADDKSYYMITPFTWGMVSNYWVNNGIGGTWVRRDNVYIPLAVNNWWVNTSSVEPYISMQHGFQQNTYFYGFGANQFNGRVPMYPLEWLIRFPNSTIVKPAIPMFYTNEICKLNIDNIIPETIINDNWVVFPIITKLGLDYEYGTLGQGVAYKIK